jgi:hypothetical protein
MFADGGISYCFFNNWFVSYGCGIFLKYVSILG